jgi:hypothetical protein
VLLYPPDVSSFLFISRKLLQVTVSVTHPHDI